MKNVELERNVRFSKEAKDALIEGVNLIGNAVKTTFGPNGNNVVIKARDGVHVTKDGATVATFVNDPDPFVSMGIEVLRDIANKTAKDVGDGTTTATILSQSIINLLKNQSSPIEVVRKLNKDCKKVIDFLEKNKKEITCKEDLVKVATLSANNDPVIGELIAKAYYQVGKDGIVTFEESENVEDKIEYTEGFQIKNGYSSPYFINTSKNTCELENVYVYISETKLQEVKKISEIADSAVRNKKSLLLIAPEFDSEILVFLFRNQNLLKSCTVISPNHGIYRETMLSDIKDILGESNTCQKVIITKETTTFIGCNSNKQSITKKVEDIKKLIKEDCLEKFDLDFHKKRLANFTSGIATIYVGGYSKVEIKERKDRIEDAICATKAALDEGILPGGGFALLRAADNLKLDYLSQVLRTPVLLLRKNSDNDILLNYDKTDFWKGQDFKNNTEGDLYDMGIVDPFLVTKTALENAVSTASLILTCECSILNMD